MEEYLSSLGDDSRPEESDIHRAFDLAFEVMTMVACSGENQPSDLFGDGSKPVKWRNRDSFTQLFESAFPYPPSPCA